MINENFHIRSTFFNEKSTLTQPNVESVISIKHGAFTLSKPNIKDYCGFLVTHSELLSKPTDNYAQNTQNRF